jgi:hypothetical protein
LQQVKYFTAKRHDIIFFGIYKVGTCKVVMYIYHEVEETYEHNNIRQVLLDYLKNNQLADTSDLWLFSVGCAGQKNHVMLQFTYTLAHILKTVKVVSCLPIFLYLTRNGDLTHCNE